jgi:LPXTG-motif cell wall-anchored protein
VNTLVSQRFLLQEDADQLIAQATASNVGDPVACTGEPVLLPATGFENVEFIVTISILLIVLLIGAVVYQRKVLSA